MKLYTLEEKKMKQYTMTIDEEILDLVQHKLLDIHHELTMKIDEIKKELKEGDPYLSFDFETDDILKRQKHTYEHQRKLISELIIYKHAGTLIG